MKKTDITLIAVVAIIIILGIAFLGKAEAKPNYDFPLKLSGDAGLTELTYAQYEEKIESKEPFIFIIERTTCSHCQNFMPVAEKFAKDYNIPIYYIDTDKFVGDEFTSLQKSNSFFKKKKESWGTPTTMILVGSDAVDFVEGETDSNGLYNLLKEKVSIETNE